MENLESLAAALLHAVEGITAEQAKRMTLRDWCARVNHPRLDDSAELVDIDTLAAELGLQGLGHVTQFPNGQVAQDMGDAIYGNALEYAAGYAEAMRLVEGVPLIWARDALRQRQLKSLLGKRTALGYDSSVLAAFWDDFTSTVIAGRFGFSFSDNGLEYSSGHHAASPQNPVVLLWRRSQAQQKAVLMVSVSGEGSCACEMHRDLIKIASNALHPMASTLYLAEAARRVILGKPLTDEI